mmetsp:Transcript_554/g.616  ORF Transcript_554/g.616 Transcript_554/m.616 type:complete len:128 (+) Transcript_554:905-1288(+)
MMSALQKEFASQQVNYISLEHDDVNEPSEQITIDYCLEQDVYLNFMGIEDLYEPADEKDTFTQAQNFLAVKKANRKNRLQKNLYRVLNNEREQLAELEALKQREAEEKEICRLAEIESIKRKEREAE